MISSRRAYLPVMLSLGRELKQRAGLKATQHGGHFSHLEGCAGAVASLLQDGVDPGDDVLGEIDVGAGVDEQFAQGLDLPGFGFGIMLLGNIL